MSEHTINALLVEHGLSITALGSGRGIDATVRESYKALKDGAEYVLVFGSDASDDMLATFAVADEVTNGTALVVQSRDEDADTLKRKAEYRNTLNVNAKTGKPRAKVTLGSVAISEGIRDNGGNVVGFVMRSK